MFLKAILTNGILFSRNSRFFSSKTVGKSGLKIHRKQIAIDFIRETVVDMMPTKGFILYLLLLSYFESHTGQFLKMLQKKQVEFNTFAHDKFFLDASCIRGYVRPSIRPSVRPSIRTSVRTSVRTGHQLKISRFTIEVNPRFM